MDLEDADLDAITDGRGISEYGEQGGDRQAPKIIEGI
jgi:hypothetical protein